MAATNRTATLANTAPRDNCQRRNLNTATPLQRSPRSYSSGRETADVQNATPSNEAKSLPKAEAQNPKTTTQRGGTGRNTLEPTGERPTSADTHHEILATSDTTSLRRRDTELTKSPHWTHRVRGVLAAIALKVAGKILVPRVVGGQLRRSPIVASRKTTNGESVDVQLVRFVF